MARLKGRNLALLQEVNGVYSPIGLSTSCSIDMDTEMVEMASGSSIFRSYKPGRHNITIQCDRLINYTTTGGDHISWISMQMSRRAITFRIATVDDGTPYGIGLEGMAYVSHQTATGQVEGYATHSITLQVTGQVTVRSLTPTALSEE